MNQTMFYLATYFVYVLNTFIVFWYGHRLFKYKKDGKTAFLICLITNTVLWFLMVSFRSFPVNLISTTVLFAVMLFAVFKCDWKLAIFNSLLMTAIMDICEYIVMFIVSAFFDIALNAADKDLILFVEETFASKFIYFTFLAILSSLSRKRNVKDSWVSSILLTILPATTFIVSLILRYQHVKYVTDTKTDILLISCEVLMFIAIVIVFFVHERTISYQQKIHEMEMSEQKQAINLEYLDILEKKDEETRIFIHDIRNNLINISNLTDESNVKKYVQEIYDKSNEISVKAKTKNRLLDVIINKYYLLCKDKNIEFNIISINENLSFINDYDISAILDNLLRNAIESAEKENSPYISLSLESDNKFHKIILKNSCSTKPVEDRNNLITTKSNKSVHGYGIKSVMKALNNYNGELEWAYNNNEFKIIVLIPK